MAGSGELSRKGNTRALNAALGSGITGGVLGPPGDQIGALSATLATGAQTTISCAASGGGAVLTKAIPDKAVICVIDSTGAVDTMEAFAVNGAQSAGATSITVQSQTVRVSHAAGSLIFLLAFKPYLALIAATTAPTDNSLGSPELAFTGYARQLVPWTAPTAADPPVAANQATVTFGPMSTADGTKVVTYGSLMDCPSGGAADNQMAWWTWGATRTPNAGDSIQISAAALTLQVFH